jgi:hypothetical protein
MTGTPAGALVLSPEVVAERLAQVKDRIARAQRGPGPVTVIAVTKGWGPAAVAAAVGAGIQDIGENYAQDLLSKYSTAPAGVRWHFLGELQRNKLSRLAPCVYLWHGLDSEGEVLALARRRPAAAVLVEVMVAPGERRHGAAPEKVPALVANAVHAGLDVRGLMAVGPADAPAEEVRRCFGEVARLGRSLGLPELSMGMTADFELAVAEGATMVRLGTALFGQRTGPDAAGPGAVTLR